jgi:hypothetical protein
MKKRKTRKRGGHFVHYNPDKPRQYPYQGQVLDVHPGDCVPSVFYFLGFSNYEDSVHLAKTFPRGLGFDDIRKILDLAYYPELHYFQKISKYNELDFLPVGSATMAIFDFDKDNAHAVVIYRQIDGVLYVNDPQLNGIASGTFHDYFSIIFNLYKMDINLDGTMNEFYVLRSNIQDHMSTDNRVHKIVIDYHASNPSGPIIELPPPGMGHSLAEQAEARQQATYNMGAAAKNWPEMDNSLLFGR